jgi:hypothetical protein
MNLLTGETRVLMEQEYILNIKVMDGSLAGGEKDGYRSIPDVQYICYNGKDSKEDAEFKQYYYNTETGKTLNTKEFWNETHQK